MINKLAAQAYENMMLSTEMTKLALSDTEATLAYNAGIGAVAGGLGGAALGRQGPLTPPNPNTVLKAINKSLDKGRGMPDASELAAKFQRAARRNKILKRGLMGLGAGAATGLGAGALINALGSHNEEE